MSNNSNLPVIRFIVIYHSYFSKANAHTSMKCFVQSTITGRCFWVGQVHPTNITGVMPKSNGECNYAYHYFEHSKLGEFKKATADNCPEYMRDSEIKEKLEELEK